MNCDERLFKCIEQLNLKNKHEVAFIFTVTRFGRWFCCYVFCMRCPVKRRIQFNIRLVQRSNRYIEFLSPIIGSVFLFFFFMEIEDHNVSHTNDFCHHVRHFITFSLVINEINSSLRFTSVYRKKKFWLWFYHLSWYLSFFECKINKIHTHLWLKMNRNGKTKAKQNRRTQRQMENMCARTNDNRYGWTELYSTQTNHNDFIMRLFLFTNFCSNWTHRPLNARIGKCCVNAVRRILYDWQPISNVPQSIVCYSSMFYSKQWRFLLRVEWKR